MLYKDFKGEKLSALGLGAMRLPLNSEKGEDINVAMVEEMVAYGMEHGINYYDTAWGYHNGMSETVMGNVLKAYDRDSFYLATKFPGYDLSNMPKVKEIFEKQLEKCRVDFFDFYLFHNVCEMNIDAYLDDEKYGIYTYLTQQKKNGRIRHLGFSAHGSLDTMKRFLDAYGKDMEFCQIQLNYVDYEFQDAKGKIELLASYGIPVWVMEPLRGGKLANPPQETVERLHEIRPDETLVAWAFRFLQSLPEVRVTLSGMSDMQQLKENIETFSADAPLSATEMDGLLAAAHGMIQNCLPCTSCRYCTAHCPQGLDIPRLITLYNEHCFTGGGFIASMALQAVPEEKQPGACVGCRSCEAVCPQQIKISEAMADFKAKLEV